MDQLLNAANAVADFETHIDKNGNIVTNNNNNQEETIMTTNNNYGEVAVDQLAMDLINSVAGALKQSKYSNIPSFFEGKEIVKSADMMPIGIVQVLDAVYGKYKDESKDDFAAIAFERDGAMRFAFVSREGMDFVRRLVDICKANKISMKKLIEQVGGITYVQGMQMKKGYEDSISLTSEDGMNNWFYTYNFEIGK